MATLHCGVKDFQAGISCFHVLMRKGKLSETRPLFMSSFSLCEYHCATTGHFHVPIYQRLREDQFHAPTDQLCREVHGNFFDQLQLLGGTRKFPCFFCKNFLNKLSF